MTRRGFVLVAVLFALVLLAALTAAGFFASLQEHRAGGNAAALLRVQAAATSAIAEATQGWDPLALNTLRPGAMAFPAVTAAPGVSLRVEAQRLNTALFMVRSYASQASAARSVSAVVRLRGFDLDPPAAARVRSVDSALLGAVVGADQVPPGWVCPPAIDTITSLLIQNTVTENSFLTFGRRNWSDLLSWAARVPAGGDSLPIQYWPGDLALAGSRMTGMLIVEGDLTLDGGAEVTGIVLVRGSLVLTGSGGVIRGALVAGQIVAASGFTPTRPVVVYSSCAVRTAAFSRAWPEALRGAPAAIVF